MAFHGPQFKGAMKNLRTVKREEAEARNAKTPEDRRAVNRKPRLKASMAQKAPWDN